MNILRALISLLFFISGIFLTIEVIVGTHGIIYLLGSLGLFLAAYAIWPSKKRGKRDDDYTVLDFIKVLIELPIEILLWIFRLLGRLFRSAGDSGFDIDI